MSKAEALPYPVPWNTVSARTIASWPRFASASPAISFVPQSIC